MATSASATPPVSPPQSHADQHDEAQDDGGDGQPYSPYDAQQPVTPTQVSYHPPAHLLPSQFPSFGAHPHGMPPHPAAAQAAYLHQLSLQQHHQVQQQQLLSFSPTRPPQFASPLQQHHPHSPPLCRMFASGGWCRFGDQCRFVHANTGNGVGGGGGIAAGGGPPGLATPSGYQQQPAHVHAALMQQQFAALQQQQHYFQQQHSHFQQQQQHQQQQQQQHQQQQQPQHQQLDHDEHDDDDDNGDALQNEDSNEDAADEQREPERHDDSERDGHGNKAAHEQDGDGGDEPDAQSERRDADEDSSSTPKSPAPSSSATTTVSSTASSPSTLSASAAPFSSSFSSSPYPSFPSASGHSRAPAGAFAPHTQPSYPAFFQAKPQYAAPYFAQPFAQTPAANGYGRTAGMNGHTAASYPSRDSPAAFPSTREQQPQDGDSEAGATKQAAAAPVSVSSPSAEESLLFGDATTGINFDKYDEIEVDVQGNDAAPAILAFSELPFPPQLQRNIQLAHYHKPTPIQKHALPIALLGRDIMACAQTGSGKCWAVGTRLRLYNGDTIAVEKVQGGELLMGDDGSPRTVTPGSLARGRDVLYRITPSFRGAAAFTVNGDHILVLRNSIKPRKVRAGLLSGDWIVLWYAVDTAANTMEQGQQLFHSEAAADDELKRRLQSWTPLEWEVSVEEFLRQSGHVQSVCQLFQSGPVSFQSSLPRLDAVLRDVTGVPATAAQVEWAAWYLGLCTGAAVGTVRHAAGRLREQQQLFAEPSVAARLLGAYGLLEQAPVPQAWICDSLNVRQCLLAGVIDGGGCYDSVREVYSIHLQHQHTAASIKLLAASLGIRTSDIRPAHDLFCLRLSGEMSAVVRRCTTSSKGDCRPLSVEAESESRCYDFSITQLDVGDYYGFTVTGSNHRFLLDDFTVTHNTAAFLFPLISLLLVSGLGQGQVTGVQGYGRNKRYCPSALILAPTRELATQIHDEAVKFVHGTSLHSVVVYGGQDIRHQFRELDRGCDILVATPGRLLDFVERGRITLAGVGYLVFDEADRMLDMGFEPQIRQLVAGADMPREGRQTLMFSATFPKEIQRLAAEFLYNYVFIAVGRVGSSSDFIRQQVEWVEEDDKQAALLRLLPSCTGLTLIFVERKKTADQLEHFLHMNGLAVASIHGDRSQHERETSLAMFRSARCPLLVATDVAARGLDIPNVMDVINFDMPSCIEDYVHRIGRTGRCGNAGTSTSLINAKNVGVLRDLHDMLRENKQLVPDWLDEMVQQSRAVHQGGGRGYRGGGRGGRPFWGARDYRQGQFGAGGARGRGGARGGFGRGGGMPFGMGFGGMPFMDNGYGGGRSVVGGGAAGPYGAMPGMMPAGMGMGNVGLSAGQPRDGW